MAKYKIWLLKLVLPFRYGRLLTAVLLFAVLYPFFSLGVVESYSDNTPALFFACIIAYIIPVFSYVTAKFEQAILDLRPILQLDDKAFEAAQLELNSVSLPRAATEIAVGILLGFAHLSFIQGSAGRALTDSFFHQVGFISSVGAVLVWMVMTTVTATLVRQTALFARLGARHTRISLLHTRGLLPFARVSIHASLSILGALALFPLMGVESDGVNLAESVPGAVGTLLPLIVIFIIPVWPIHRRLAAKKERELDIVDEQIDLHLGKSDTVEHYFGSLETITPLLNYRSEIAHISTWPFDSGAITRLAFYLFIPPLTWAGAALIERLVDSFL